MTNQDNRLAEEAFLQGHTSSLAYWNLVRDHRLRDWKSWPDEAQIRFLLGVLDRLRERHLQVSGHLFQSSGMNEARRNFAKLLGTPHVE